jgi:iron complex transport system ATP-binding protein
MKYQVNNLRFSYGQTPVIRDLNFSLREGEWLTVLGPNGSGKSTLISVLLRILEKNGGSVTYEGRDLETWKRKELAQRIAVVYQKNEVPFGFSVREIIEMGRYPHQGKWHHWSEGDEKAIGRAVSLTRVEKFLEKNFNELSGGEQQRVLIARAIAQEPEVLILDEPIAHLDLRFQYEVLHLCQKLKKEQGLTILSVLHEINLAAEFSDRMLLMNKGFVLAKGTPAEVIKPGHIHDAYGINIEIVEKNGKPYLFPIF